uniref:Myotubularin phosphatase domain-containing protein n=1 Tax=Anisakis simplex TaxID=6269 RepID=A0A0M3JEH6_ANISI
LNRPPRSWIDSISAFSPSDDSVIQQQHQQDQQTYFDGPPPSYDETCALVFYCNASYRWEMQEGGSRLAPRISTPLNPTTPRQPAISIRDQQQQQTPNADGPVLGFLWTILSETLEFWITLYEIVARNI